MSSLECGPEWLGVARSTPVPPHRPDGLSPQSTLSRADWSVGWLYSITVHHHCSISRVVLRIWPWSRPKKEDWLQKKDRTHWRPGCRRQKTWRLGELQYRAPASSGGQFGELQYWAQLTSRAGVVGVGYLWILLIQEPPEPAVLYSFPGRGPKTGSRRRIVIKEDLVAEECLAGELLIRALSTFWWRVSSFVSD